MEKKIVTVQYEGKSLHISHLSEDGLYVLATFADDQQSKFFKLESAQLNLSDKDKATLTKTYSKI